MRSSARAVLLLWLQLAVAGCQPPSPPPEVSLAASQEQDLRSGGGEIYARAELEAYSRDLRAARAKLLKEQSRFAWLVDYGPVQQELAQLLARGGQIQEQIVAARERSRSGVLAALAGHQRRAERLAALAGAINEGRVARKALTGAEVLEAEARALLAREEYQEAGARLAAGARHLQHAGEALRRVAGRYADPRQIAGWQRLVEQAKEDSRRQGAIGIVVSKLDRTLTVLKDGAEIRRYDIGLGRNGLNDKSYAGDQATPEGRYRVVKKVPDSRYFRALLINYPNEQDRKRFAAARKGGLIPATAAIGGLVEIHGGGTGGITDGCVSLADKDMAEVFELAETGTQVTIVGTVHHENAVSTVLE